MTDLPLLACRLELPALRTQLERYRRLGGAATRIDRSDGALVVTFGADVDEQLLHETIEIERGCCSFFEIIHRPAERRLTITVGRPEQEPALDALYYAFTGRDEPAQAMS